MEHGGENMKELKRKYKRDEMRIGKIRVAIVIGIDRRNLLCHGETADKVWWLKV